MVVVGIFLSMVVIELFIVTCVYAVYCLLDKHLNERKEKHTKIMTGVHSEEGFFLRMQHNMLFSSKFELKP